jgi:hypothetical protein
MDNISRINAVLHQEKPDKIPFAPYDNLVPRGEFERMLRNRGMGLLTRVNSIWEETPHLARIQRRNHHSCPKRCGGH